KAIINYINEFKLEDLDGNSNLRNFVINFYIKPNTYVYNANLKNPKMLQCQNCLLPIHNIFFEDNYVKEYTEWKEWTCINCDSFNEKHLVVCKNKDCLKPKAKEIIKDSKSFFRLFTIPFEDDETLIFEEVMFNLPLMSENDDILKEI